MDDTMESFEINASKCDSHPDEPAWPRQVSTSFSSCADLHDIDMPTQPKVGLTAFTGKRLVSKETTSSLHLQGK